MVEYALVISLLVGVGAFTIVTFLGDFIEALQKYYDSYYVLISLPIP